MRFHSETSNNGRRDYERACDRVDAGRDDGNGKRERGAQSQQEKEHWRETQTDWPWLLCFAFFVRPSHARGVPTDARVPSRRVAKIIKSDKDITLLTKEAIFLISIAAVRSSGLLQSRELMLPLGTLCWQVDGSFLHRSSHASTQKDRLQRSG
jgi:hypothetical protein